LADLPASKLNDERAVESPLHLSHLSFSRSELPFRYPATMEIWQRERAENATTAKLKREALDSVIHERAGFWFTTLTHEHFERERLFLGSKTSALRNLVVAIVVHSLLYSNSLEL